MLELRPGTGEQLGLTLRETAVIVLHNARFERRHIAQVLELEEHDGERQVRGIISDLCRTFGCPAKDLHAAALLRLNGSENSGEGEVEDDAAEDAYERRYYG